MYLVGALEIVILHCTTKHPNLYLRLENLVLQQPWPGIRCQWKLGKLKAKLVLNQSLKNFILKNIMQLDNTGFCIIVLQTSL